MEGFYLTTYEYAVFSRTRLCQPIRRLKYGERDDVLLASCDPPWTEEEVGKFEHESGCEGFVFVAPRLEGFSMFEDLASQGVTFPVYIWAPPRSPQSIGDEVAAGAFKEVAWGEVYSFDQKPKFDQWVAHGRPLRWEVF